jgi:HlyD family secretion protein
VPADAPSTQQSGGQAVQQFRARIVEELKPSDAQKARLEEIFSDARQKFARVRDVPGEAERRRQAERIRAETNSRIAEMLTPEQRPAWERLLAESGARGQAATGRVYVLDGGEPKPRDVRLGLTDGATTELVAGDIAEGTEVIIGAGGAGGSASQPGGGGLPRPRFF